jgi:photosystem II stability/assembly factor-like uncharacterized protein
MWQRIDSPMGTQAVWSVAIDPRDSRHMIAGVGTPDPGAIFVSRDGGASWKQASVEVAAECAAVGTPRPLALAIDPTDGNSMWAAFEVDGVRVSRDGGDTWHRTAEEIGNPDIHCVLVTAGPPKTVFVLVNNDVWSSTDNGETWRPANARSTFPWHYVRHVSTRPADPSTVFVCVGDATPGRTGAIMRSNDAGETWSPVGLPVQPNSAMWFMEHAKTDPELMFAASRYGNLYRSEDAGASWERLWREFSEVSSIAWLPS